MLESIISWYSSAKLIISERKMETIVLKSDAIKKEPGRRNKNIGRRNSSCPDRKRKTVKKANLVSKVRTIRIGNSGVKFKDSFRYLAVHFDRKMGVRTHCRYLSNKIGSLFAKLGRLANRDWRLLFSKRFTEECSLTFMYAAAEWSNLCMVEDYKKLSTL